MNQKPKLFEGTFVPSRELLTEQHLAACLSTLRELQAYVLPAREKMFSDTVPHKPELDGGVTAAVDTTLMSVCSRIEKIFSEEARWDISASTQFFHELTQTQLAQQKFLAEQTRSAKLVQCPSFQLRPELSHDGTSFFAIYGDASKPGGQIIGQGPTPEKALKDFDAAFKRTPADQLYLISEQTTTPPNE